MDRFATPAWTDAVDDVTPFLAGEPVTVLGSARNFARIVEARGVTTLGLREISQAQLAIVAEMSWLRDLRVFGFRGTDLSPLARLENLEMLSLIWAPKLEDLRPLASLARLEVLALGDFGRVDDFDVVAELPALRALAIESAMLGKQKCRSLSAFPRARNLEELSLLAYPPEEELRHLGRMPWLKELVLPNRFPVREFARLSVCLPETACASFAPVRKLATRHMTMDSETGAMVEDTDAPNILLTGSPSRLLRASDPGTPGLVAARTALFERWRAYYRTVPDPASDTRVKPP